MYYRYVVRELRHRINRTLVNILGIAVGIALFVSINAVTAAYKAASSQPLKDIGVDLIVQRAEKQSSQPAKETKSMRGIRLPFSNQLFSRQDMAALERIEGIDASAGALLLWEFSKNGFRSLMGVGDESFDLGAAKTRDWIIKGRFPEGPDEIALEKHFARFQKLALGEMFSVGGRPFKIVGLIEIKEGAQVTAANIYMPIDSTRMLLGKGGPDAVNLIYMRLKDPAMLNRIKSQLAERITAVSISSSDSFLELMGGVSKISEKYSVIASMVALLGAIMLIVKAMISNLVERSHEIGILKTVGWTEQDVQRQLALESFLQTIAGGLLGILVGYVISSALSFLTISIPIPWELNPVPAMARLSQGATQVIRLPISVSWYLSATAMLLSVGAGGVAALLMSRRAAAIKPADSLRQL
jgi:ABC-type antimicrobial peptide transport system permease subunit